PNHTRVLRGSLTGYSAAARTERARRKYAWRVWSKSFGHGSLGVDLVGGV
ncbi:MAG: hypothetical protein JWQ65_134, partial [Devosia sp.]|nr:hypothetical protein [Devosia sp.]